MKQNLQEASDILAKHNIGALIVVDLHGKPIGMISIGDVVKAQIEHLEVEARTLMS